VGYNFSMKEIDRYIQTPMTVIPIGKYEYREYLNEIKNKNDSYTKHTSKIS
jgi:hypothetical protein